MRKLILAGVLSLLAAGLSAQAAQTTTFVDGRSGPWLSELNPAFAWGDAILPPDVVSAASGLAITPGESVTITYVSGLTNGGGGGIFADGNGNPIFGDLTGAPNTPSAYISQAQAPTYFIALLGTFADAQGVIVGNPFKIGNGPYTAVVPGGASELLMGVNDGGGGFFDNSGGLNVLVQTVPEPSAALLMFAGVAVLAIGARRLGLGT